MTGNTLFRHADVNQFVLVSNEDLGAVEVATFIALILFGISLSQGYNYYHRWSEDSRRMKFLVGTILFLEASHSFTASQTIYYDTVTRFTTAQPNSYPLSTTVLLETFITVIVQCFFSYRIFRLSENVFITATCLSLSFLRFVGGLALTIESFIDVPNNPNGILFVQRLSWLITSALAVGGAADVLIAAAMLVYLRRFGSPTNLKSTTMVINRLVRWSLQTRLLTRCDTFNFLTSGIITSDKPGVSCDDHLLPNNGEYDLVWNIHRSSKMYVFFALNYRSLC
ncbi:hypothetical protein BJ912DRAFT_1048826 [Pholiota molesta]|nr:hypothetical protein BJ912DRAFT_1048826 [Pholiota molesta]